MIDAIVGCVQRSLLILGWGEREREGSLFHALSALEGPAARKVPSLISHGHLEGCRVAEEVIPSSSGKKLQYK